MKSNSLSHIINFMLFLFCFVLLLHAVHHQAQAARQVLVVAAPVLDPAAVEAAALAQAAALVGVVVDQVAAVVVSTNQLSDTSQMLYH